MFLTDESASRLWRFRAKVLGKLGEQFEKSSQDPVAAWLTRTGGVLAICEIATEATVSNNAQQLVPEEVANANSCQED